MPRQKHEPDALLNPFQSALPIASEDALLRSAGLAEATQFFSHRCKAYASYFDKLAKCANPADFAALQTTFWADAQRDYLNEGAALVSTATLTQLPAFARRWAPLAWPHGNGAARAH